MSINPVQVQAAASISWTVSALNSLSSCNLPKNSVSSILRKCVYEKIPCPKFETFQQRGRQSSGQLTHTTYCSKQSGLETWTPNRLSHQDTPQKPVNRAIINPLRAIPPHPSRQPTNQRQARGLKNERNRYGIVRQQRQSDMSWRH